jgi:hypothetical protein
MKPKELKPTQFVKYDKEGTLSIPFLVLLLRTVLEKGKPFRFEATGDSMSPFIRNGDIITVSPLLGAPPRLGDVVAYIRPERRRKLVVHRVIGRRNGSYLIRGDSAPDHTDLVPKADILGRVSRVKRNGRRVCLGLGPERRLVAFVIRNGLLLHLLMPLWRLVRPIVSGYRREHRRP